MTDAEFLQAVKRSVHEIDPQAEVWLFGSRARGDARPDSDWDFLILTAVDLSKGNRWQFSDHLTDLSLKSGQVISSVVYPYQEKARLRVTDLYKNVVREGHRL
ncbi:nucleotidyltransferase domain-containing protein [Fibrella arboris]|uniref:nucleotidyltransferase domain-containing protein n=1 Tax=Fibrella arboris TaxID=3242486 RepID=UPI0035229058